ncbi:MAG: hypothetical protein FWD71_01420 [Oscillospiraceae bacterium]|nr:hypothetical protein [Oscillospiraceae bacterium]
MRKKDHIRDYAIAAFRFYKSVGGVKKYKDKLWDDALANHKYSGEKSVGISNPVEADIMRAQSAIDNAYAAVADLEAVERTLDIIAKYDNGTYIRKALEIVYMPNEFGGEVDKPIERGDIQDRVHKAGIYIPAAESTVYLYLSKARMIFAIERGLRL